MRTTLILATLVSIYTVIACNPKELHLNAKSRFISEQMSTVIDDEKHYSTYWVTYNSNGDRAVTESISNDTTATSFSKTTNKYTYQYDDKGFLVKSTGNFSINSTSTVLEIKTTVLSSEASQVYHYDNNNRLIKRVGSFKGNTNGYLTGEATITSEYTYDSKGILSTCVITSETYKPGGSVLYETTK